MTDNSPTPESNTPKELIQEFREMLMNDQLDEALHLKNINKLNEDIASKEALEIFNSKKELGEIKSALNIAELFNIEGEEVTEAIFQEFKKLNIQRLFLEAANWGYSNGLPDVDYLRSATYAFEEFLNSGDIDNAIEVFDKFVLSKEDLLSTTIEVFNKSILDGDFHTAARLGEKFGFSKERTVNAAYKSFLSSVESKNFNECLETAKNFYLFDDKSLELLNETEQEKFLKSVMSDYINPLCDGKLFKNLSTFAEVTKIFDVVFQNVYLSEFRTNFISEIALSHNDSLNNRDEKTAKTLKDSFQLLTSFIPKELSKKIMESAEKYHNILLDDRELDQAINIKKEYSLFPANVHVNELKELHYKAFKLLPKLIDDNNDFSAKLLIKEYDLPKPESEKVILLSILKFVDENNYDRAFKMIDTYEIKIKDEATVVSLNAKYESLVKKKEYDAAINLVKNFKLNRSFIEKAAYMAWEEKIKSAKWDDAIAVKEKYNIPKKRTKQLAKAYYLRFKEQKEFEMASMIRRSYKLSVNFMDLMMEIFYSIFKSKK